MTGQLTILNGQLYLRFQDSQPWAHWQRFNGFPKDVDELIKSSHDPMADALIRLRLKGWEQIPQYVARHEPTECAQKKFYAIPGWQKSTLAPAY